MQRHRRIKRGIGIGDIDKPPRLGVHSECTGVDLKDRDPLRHIALSLDHADHVDMPERDLVQADSPTRVSARNVPVVLAEALTLAQVGRKVPKGEHRTVSLSIQLSSSLHTMSRSFALVKCAPTSLMSDGKSRKRVLAT